MSSQLQISKKVQEINTSLFVVLRSNPNAIKVTTVASKADTAQKTTNGGFVKQPTQTRQSITIKSQQKANNDLKMHAKKDMKPEQVSRQKTMHYSESTSSFRNTVRTVLAPSAQTQVRFKPASYMRGEITNIKQQRTQLRHTLGSTMDEYSINQDKAGNVSFQISGDCGQSNSNMNSNFQDQYFKPQAVRKPKHGSLLRRANMNVYNRAQARSLVVLQAVADGIMEQETEEQKQSADQVESVKSIDSTIEQVEEIPEPKWIKPGKLSTKMIKIMEEENVRQDRQVTEIPEIYPLGNKKFWNFQTFPRAQKGWKEMNKKDQIVSGIIMSIHALSLAAPFTFGPGALKWLGINYTACLLGITISFHRQLTHKSFETPKPLEHFLAFLGTLAVQGHPIEWVSAHRHHHSQCDDVADPHSPRDGFWWSHMGWLFDSKTQALLFDTTNCRDLKRDDFYMFLKANYLKITMAQPFIYYLLGGFQAVVWGFALRTVAIWHVTWMVNSVSHIWGRQMFKTGDLSMNNPLIGILAFGEGWHNNHHAFESSVRHGLKWWQFDLSWLIIVAMEKVGLAKKLRYPTQKQMKAIAWNQDQF